MLQPRIEYKPSLTVIGMRRSYRHALSPDATNMQVIGPLWEEFVSRAESIPNRASHAMFGVIYGLPEAQRSHPHELEYIAAVPVNSTTDVPAGMVTWTVPAGAFAIFEHHGPIARIAETVREIYRQWLPASEYEHSGIADVELYDERFCADGQESVMEYWVSIKKKG
jgi:AraC family transcriptional regulator